MGNYTFPAFDGVSSVLRWTNQVTGTDWAVGIVLFFFSFMLPLVYMINNGQDKTESTLIASISGTIIIFFGSLLGVVPNLLFFLMMVLTGIVIMFHALSEPDK